MSGRERIAVHGAGIAGLTAAYRLQSLGHDVTVFEAGDRVGGNIVTEERDGCRIEWGPNGFLDNEPATLELVERLGLTDHLVRAREQAARRFVYRAGRLRELPASPPKFLFSDCLPLLGRLRVALEPFARGAPGGDETVYDFARRRIGKAAADVLIDSVVTGVFAGDPKRLSVRSAFPKLVALEREYDSLIKGAKGRGFGPRGVLTSFDFGLQVLVDKLASEVTVVRGHRITRLERDGFDRVVCTIPAPRLAPLCEGELSEQLASIPTGPVVVVATVFADTIGVPDAFGFLVPRGQGPRILGTLYDSSIFPHRAPEGRRLFRTLIGGRRDPAAVELTDDELIDLVARDLHRIWGAFPEPLAISVWRHPLGIAQYEVGHDRRVARIGELTPDWLTLTGASYRGVALNLCVKEALALS